MNINIKNLIGEVANIGGALKIPINEVQNFNPPNINFPTYKNNSNISVNEIWSGGFSEEVNLNADKSEEKIKNIRPFINDLDKLKSVLSDYENYDNHIWGSPFKNGTEVVAWYKSFHYSKYWGIYISYSSFLSFASKYYKLLGDPEKSIDLAWGAIMAHEAVHYGIDVACTQLEIITNKAIYIKSKDYINQQTVYSFDEEMIAEGVLLRYLKTNKRLINSINHDFNGFMDYIYESLEYRPPGYRDAMKAMTMSSYRYHCDEYLRKLLTLSGFSSNSLTVVSDLSNLMPLVNDRSRLNPGFVDWSQCPLYIVDDTSVSNFPKDVFQFIHSISGILESSRFQKLIYPRYTSEWKKTLTLLSNPSYPKNSLNLDFKRWPNEDDCNLNLEAWSVRVGGRSTNLRAHIDHKVGTSEWIADRFGNADKMGHHKNKK
jgi:hypothetical protein